jgi:hypothetical protein
MDFFMTSELQSGGWEKKGSSDKKTEEKRTAPSSVSVVRPHLAGSTYQRLNALVGRHRHRLAQSATDNRLLGFPTVVGCRLPKSAFRFSR